MNFKSDEYYCFTKNQCIWEKQFQQKIFPKVKFDCFEFINFDNFRLKFKYWTMSLLISSLNKEQQFSLRFMVIFNLFSCPIHASQPFYVCVFVFELSAWRLVQCLCATHKIKNRNRTPDNNILVFLLCFALFFFVFLSFSQPNILLLSPGFYVHVCMCAHRSLGATKRDRKKI